MSDQVPIEQTIKALCEANGRAAVLVQARADGMFAVRVNAGGAWFSTENQRLSRALTSLSRTVTNLAGKPVQRAPTRSNRPPDQCADRVLVSVATLKTLRDAAQAVVQQCHEYMRTAPDDADQSTLDTFAATVEQLEPAIADSDHAME